MMTRKAAIPQLRTRASFVPNSWNEKDRTIEVMWGVGARVRRHPWFGEAFDEELSMDPAHVQLDFLASGRAPVLDTHNRDSIRMILGKPIKAWVANGEGRAIVQLGERDEVRALYPDFANGTICNVSVGYQVLEYERMPATDGQEVPVYRATKWRPKEISFVPLGADEEAASRSDEQSCECVLINNSALQRREEESKMEPNKEQTLNTTAPVAVAAPSVDTDAVRKEALATERKRVDGIRQLVKKHGLDGEFETRAINEGMDLEKVRSHALDVLAERGEKSAIDSKVRIEAGGQDETQTRRDGMANALMHRSHSDQFKMTDIGRQFANMSLIRMAEECVGRAARGMGPGELVSRALSSSDFPLILENVGSKMLTAAYNIQSRQWELVSVKGTLRDYKPAKRYQVGDSPGLLEIKEGGEYKQGSFSEKAESVQLVDYGRKLTFTRQMIINDDLMAFQRLIGGFGGASGRKIEALVFAILDGNPTMSDGVVLFHATHGNLGSAAAISEASLAALEVLFLNQKTLDDQEYLNITPKYLFCGTAKKLEAQKILASISPTQSGNVNPYAGAYTPLVNPRISGNKWGLIAAPSDIGVIEVDFLEGESGPVVDSHEDFDTDGVNFKVRQTASVKAIEHKGVARNPGA